MWNCNQRSQYERRRSRKIYRYVPCEERGLINKCRGTHKENVMHSYMVWIPKKNVL